MFIFDFLKTHKNKIKIFFIFTILFLMLFVFIHQGFGLGPVSFWRAVKSIVSILMFAFLYSIIAENSTTDYIALICGLFYYTSIAGTFSLYTSNIGINYAETHYELFFACSLVVLLTSLKNFLGKNKIIIIFAEFIVIAVSIIEIVYYLQFGISVNSDTIFLLLQTNFNESLIFIQTNILIITFLVFVLSALLFYLYRLNKNENNFLTSKKIWLSVLIFVFTLFIDNKFVFTDEHLYLHRDFNIAYGYFKQLEMMAQKEELGESITSEANAQKVVIVLGESANRDYMQAFGYERENTPWLNSMKAEYPPNFLLYDKAYTSYRLTNKALIYLLTEKSQYNDKEIYSSLNLIDIAKAAGYKTYWFSRQGNISNYREAYNIVAQRADVKVFLNNSKFDDELIKELESVNDSERSLIIVHLIGSHYPYTNYPDSFSKFNSDNINDQYDNSIYYTDYVLSEIFKKVNKKSPADLFIYISDHGESKEMLRTNFNFQMSHIPMVIYFSDNYIKNNPNKYQLAVKRQHAYFTSDMFYDTFLGLIGVNDKYYMRNQDLFDNEYSFNKNNLTTEYGTQMLINDNYDKN